ncbi:MAG TPA: NAD(P)H-dependent glycerol-3-phosphate dehydrogenase [Gemmatimonadaceae bacterium]|nr:NAD(P)H-dependent glycerol-3-phosphate dehydrogenase [Gemmatimonadaceae bacterium]
MRCAVVGAGAWGTALADLLARMRHEVTLWAYEPEVAEHITRHGENARFLPGVRLQPSLRATADLASALAGAALVAFATPSHVLRSVARQGDGTIPADATVAVATKGIERGSLALMSQVIADEVPGRPVVALSGPSFASEVAAGYPTALVAASRDADAAAMVQQAFSGERFRVYTHHDVVGVELGGALKNVIAVAAGITEGLGLGFNARAALITRGLAEMTRLAVALGASPLTLSGLAGVGDLVLTCTGSLSRNRSLGAELAAGVPLDRILASRDTVAEGVVTTQSAHALAAREDVEMPIVAAVHRILFERHPPQDAITELMTRELRAEHER